MYKVQKLKNGESVVGFTKEKTRNYYRVNYKAMHQVDTKFKEINSGDKNE